jgi:exodeoxyribonuclease-3
MRLVSWNVNGVRAAVRKDFITSVATMQPDVLCLQETKAQDDQVLEALQDLQGYEIQPYSAIRKGYSGTCVISRKPPLSLRFGIGNEEHDQEGRVITAEFADYFLVTVYTPNSGAGLKRLEYRAQWDIDFLAHLKNWKTASR